MRAKLTAVLDWIRGRDEGAVIRNATSLVGATLTTAGLGAAYWAIAARVFTPAELGAGAAALSTLMLVGQISTVGLGTVLMGELAHHRSAERPMIYTGVGVAAAVGAIVGAIAILLAARFVPELAGFATPLFIALFASGAAATAAGLVLDQALLGLLRGGLQLLRNTVASLAKLGALGLIAVGLVAGRTGTMLLATWVLGTVISLGLLAVVHRIARVDADAGPFRLPRGMPSLAVRHHLLNLSILAPGLLLPLVVTLVTSAEANAYFYIAYLIAGFGWAGPTALATALYASGSRAVGSFVSRIRMAFWLSLAGAVALNLFMLFGAEALLSVFGSAYADRAALLLRLFSLGIVPVTINSLYVAITRIERRFVQGTVLMMIGMVIEFAFVIAGGELGGIDGVGYGWLVGYSLGTVPFLPTVYRVLVRGEVRRLDTDQLGRLPELTRPGPAPARVATPPSAPPSAAPATAAPAPAARAPAPAAARGAAPVPARVAIALLTDGPELARWHVACAAALLDEPSAELVGWLHLDRPSGRRSVHPNALAAATAAELPTAMPAPMSVATFADGRSDAHAFDVLLDLTAAGDAAIPARDHVARWAFVFGPDRRRDPLRVGLRDLALGRGTIDVALIDCAEGRTLRSGVLRTTAWSIDAQFEQLLVDTAAWLADAAGNAPHGTAAAGAIPVATRAEPGACGEPPVHRRFEAPLPLLWLAARTREIAAANITLVRRDDWNIGLLDRPIEGVLTTAEPSTIRWLPTRPGRYAADPFGVEVGGQLHVLFEDFDVEQRRGIISATTLEPDGRFSDPEPVLDTEGHASYPFLLEADGEVWMIPETSASREVRLYRSTGLPDRWHLEARLLSDVQVSDPTIVQHGDRWWMFGTSRSLGVDHALRVWHAPGLTGPWTVHRNDPVKFDARSARPGGTPFVVDGVLYRPAQDCSRRYGGSVVVNRIDELTPTAFREVPVAGVRPRAPYPDGLHTLSAAGARTLIDGNAFRFAPGALASRLFGRQAPRQRAPG